MDDDDDAVAKPRPLQEMLSDTTRVAYYEDYLRFNLPFSLSGDMLTHSLN